MNGEIINASRAWHTEGGGNHRRGLAARAAGGKYRAVGTLHGRGSVHASPVFAKDGAVIVADASGLVQRFEPDGTRRWKRPLGAGVFGTPAVDLERAVVFVPTLAGAVHALDVETGEGVWRTSIIEKRDPRILSGLTFLPKNNLVAACSWEGRYDALDGTTGEQRLRWPAGSSPRAALCASEDETVFFVRAEPKWENDERSGVRLLKLNPAGGEEASLRFEPAADGETNEIWTTAPPVLDEERGVVYAIANVYENGVFAAVSTSGETLWTQKYERMIEAPPAVLPDGAVALGDMGGNLTVYNPDGSKRWTYETGAEFIQSGPVCAADGTLFVCDTWGRVHQAGPAGKGEAVFEAPRAVQGRPSFSEDGRLFVPCGDGNVYILAPA